MKELEYPFDSDYLFKNGRKLKKQLLSEGGPFIDKRIAILGGSTTSAVKDMLELFLLNFGIKPFFYESEYNKYFEDGMFENPELKEFKPDLIYIHTTSRNIDVFPKAADDKETARKLQEDVFFKFKALWESIFDKYGCAIIQNNFEPPMYRLLGNSDCVYPGGAVNFINGINAMFADYAYTHKDLYIHDINYEASCYGLNKWTDLSYWYMYKYAMTLSAIPECSYGVARIIKSIYGKNKKALSLDLDNTLWGGVIGDDGPENIEVGQETPMAQGYSEFQSYLKRHAEIGVILAVNSKNNDDVARKGFERADSVLKLDDFAAFYANWDNKDLNLKRTAESLTLLPESFVFVDDNPVERGLVAGNVSGVAVPEMDGVENYIKILDRSGFFEVTALSKDDAERAKMYRENAIRSNEMAKYEDYDSYLKSLEMKAEIGAFVPEYLDRIAQLTNKSNQFNLTTWRLTRSEIEKMAADSAYVTLYGKLADKFGDNGVVSVVIAKVNGDTADILLWLMSCRVLKRDMEFAMMGELVKKLKALGVTRITAHYYPTAKNAMVKDFYALHGFVKEEEDEAGNALWAIDVDKYNEKKHNIAINV